MSITFEQAETIQKTVIEQGKLHAVESIVDSEGENVAEHFFVEMPAYCMNIDFHLFRRPNPTDDPAARYLFALQWGAAKVKAMWLTRYKERNSAPADTYLMEKLGIGEVDANIVIGALRKAGFYE